MTPIRRCPVCAADLTASALHCSGARCRWTTCECGTVVSPDHLWIAPATPSPR